MRSPSPGRPGPLPRRALLITAGGVLLAGAGCSGRPGTPAPGTPPPSSSSSSSSSSAPATSAIATATATATATGTPPPTPSAGPPATTAWTPGPGEVEPDVKLRAVQLVEALGAWPAGEGGADAARARVSALGLDPALVDQAGTLRPTAEAAALQVVDAQYGGILTDSASVLVVCDQWTEAADGTVTAGGTTVDVRLSSAQPRWSVTALHPAQPGDPAGDPGAAARQVLTEPRIQLPPASVADVRSGAIHTTVLEAMLTLSRTYRMYVSVVRSGHPIYVFGTDRPSDHPPGRAFDVWQIDGHAVVDPGTPHDLVDGFMRAAAAAGSYNVGGPRQLSGGTSGQFFSDDTHQDHVHIGFRT
ncbi:hypothetical protein [Kitasatospora sp. NPDC050543]|uniref:hypothetical protein n=1 Tax=Kitasatospora sp. NPDC050543 TaxID=3364054 RepID=UPI00378D54BE